MSETVLLAAIAAVGSIAATLIAAIVAIMTAKQNATIERTERSVNGQLQRFVEITATSSRAEGVAAGAAGEPPEAAAASRPPPPYEEPE